MPKGSKNHVVVIGRLGAKPEVRYTSSGKSVTTADVATNEGYYDKNNTWQSKTEWHKVVLWGDRLVNEATTWEKGDIIYVEGKLATRVWTDKNNIDHEVTEIIAREAWSVIRKPATGTESTLQAESNSVPEQTGDVSTGNNLPPEEDEVPF